MISLQNTDYLLILVRILLLAYNLYDGNYILHLFVKFNFLV